MKIYGTPSWLVAAATIATVNADDFSRFDGDPSGENSWFNADLWFDHPDYPVANDRVWMDTSDTYGNVDSGNVEDLDSLVVAKEAFDVELEISTNRFVSVQNNVIVGEDAGSKGTVTLNSDAKLEVGGDLTIGASGEGILDTNGGDVTVGGSLQIGDAGMVDMDGGKLFVSGDQLGLIHDYLHSGDDKIVPNLDMATYAIFDVTNDVTIVRGPPGDEGSGGVVRSASCPTSGELLLTYEDGDTLELTASSTLCALVEVDTAAYEISSVKLKLKPVARSYSGNSWEAYAGDHSSLGIDCSGSTCQMSPPAPKTGRALLLKTYSPPSYSPDDISARFLEKVTFGPTREEIAAFNDPESWVSNQMDIADITSHRAFFRERLTSWHSESSYHALLHANPCEEGARYRRYAFLPTDHDRIMEVQTSPVNSALTILSVDGITRTVVEGPVQYGEDDTIDGELDDGTYILCGWWEEVEGTHTRVQMKSCESCSCKHMWVNGVYGNPAVRFDDDHQPDSPVIDLGNDYQYVLTDSFRYSDFENNLLELTTTLPVSGCSEIVPGAPEAGHIGSTTNGNGEVEYWIHSTSFEVQTNTLDQPLDDGGKFVMDQSSSAPFERQRAVCSNVPRNFLNEDHCVLSTDACFNEEGGDTDIDLDEDTIRQFYIATGGASGTDTLYVYAAQGMWNELGNPMKPEENKPTPCTPGERSRWIPTSDCSGGTSVGDGTRDIFADLLQYSPDTSNEYMRDIFFPVAGTTCDEGDDTAFDFKKVQVGSQCWEHVHPDYLNIYVFNYWVENHPGGPDKIMHFADVEESAFLTFPSWHDMWRWNKNVKNFPYVGRLGDRTTYKSLPEELTRDDVANSFGLDSGAAADSGAVMVCGSPFEVATDYNTNSGPKNLGGFDMETEYNNTLYRKRMQRRSIWVDIALKAPDQLRQRMAHALSQILVVSPDSISDDDYTESFLSYHDIFVRHAFGNYMDILREVTYHPLMAEMLTYINGESTGYAWWRDEVVQQADENYAREVLQLFSVGLYRLHQNGTLQLDENGNDMRTYTNDDLTEYAKVYVGLVRSSLRGNIEDPRRPGDGGDNQIDPVMIDAEEKDHFPKLGLDGQYIGDGYPLCTDLPPQHFLQAGAKYLVLGSNPKPDLIHEKAVWDRGSPKRLSLTPTSSLAAALCNGNVANCQPVGPSVILSEDVPCDGEECSVHEPRTFQAAPGMWFEYVRPACVNHALFNDPKTIRRRSRGWKGGYMCGNPAALDASVICCNSNDRDDWRYELFGGERVTFSEAADRCSVVAETPTLCKDPYPSSEDCRDPSQGGCDDFDIFFWTQQPCNVQVKVNPEGRIAIVHEHGVDTRPQSETARMLRNDTKSFFRGHWESDDELSSFLGDYSNNCIAMGCEIDLYDGLCLCHVSVETEQAFQDDSDLISIENVIKTASIGAFASEISSGGGAVTDIPDTVTKYPAGALSEDTIFEFTDEYGRVHRRKNVVSWAKIGNTTASLKLRNPVTFFTVSDYSIRDARYELDAALEHYFYHPNIAPFLAVRLAQRFGNSNPSPRYIETIAQAFRTGTYGSIGSGNYGCLKATMAAILLDPESTNPVLDADPTSGSLFEPYLKLIKIMRSLGLNTDPSAPFLRFDSNLQDMIGQEAHRTPSVFSFFLPEYQPAGRVNAAGLVSPESQVLNGPKGINLLNMMISLIKYGVNDCYGGFGYRPVDRDGWASDRCVIGDSWNYGELSYDATALNLANANDVVDDLATLLTAGRLSQSSRNVIAAAFDETLDSLATIEETVRPTPEGAFFEAVVNAQQLIAVSPEFHTTNIPSRTGSSRTLEAPRDAPTEPYKSVVLLFLAGGADSYNMIAPVPGTCAGMGSDNRTLDEQYLYYRDMMAFDASKGEFDVKVSATNQPCTEFALHHRLSAVQQLYNEGDAIFFANTGVVNQNGMTRENIDQKTRTQLFAHNAMQLETQKVDPYNALSGTGALGRAKDVLHAKGLNVDALNIDLSSISLDGAPGASSAPYVVPRNGVNNFAERPEKEAVKTWRLKRGEEYFNIEGYAGDLNSESDGFSGMFADLWSDTVFRGIGDAGELKNDIETLGNSSDEIWYDGGDYDLDESSLAEKLEVVSKLMQTQERRKTDRDVFFVEFSGFDHHDSLKQNLDPKMEELNENIDRFVRQLKDNGQWEQTAIYITSEFARTITPNSNAGSDHAWGQNTMLLGGAVKGKKMLGKYPDDISPTSPLSDGERGRFIPTTSNDAIWNGVLSWFGVAEADLDYCLPNRGNTEDPFLGVSSPLFTEGDLFSTAASGGVAETRRLRGQD